MQPSQVFDTTARVVECAHCGAPLSGGESSEMRCAYCGATNQLGVRPREVRPQLTPAQEIARLSSLKAQLEHRLRGHVYDMSRVPPRLTELKLDAGAAHLFPVWNKLKQSSAGLDLEAERVVCWLALEGARRHVRQGEATAARAKLETGLDLVSDDGMRQLLRCELALEASRHKEAAAARGWLAECNPAAEVIELDTCFRVATARLALLEGDLKRTRAALGEHDGDVPLDAAWRVPVNVMRRHARELQGLEEPAPLPASELEYAKREDLAPKARLGFAARQVRSLRAQQENAASPQEVLLKAIFLGPWLSLTLTLIMSAVGCATDTGPAFGLTSDYVCAKVCPGCAGPFSHVFGEDIDVLCDGPAGKPSTFNKEYQRFQFVKQHPQQVVPGGEGTLVAVGFFLYYPVSALLTLLLAWRSWLADREAAKSRLPQLAETEAEFVRLGGDLADAALVPELQVRRALPVWLFLLLPLLLMAACAGVNLGLRTP